MSNTEPLSRDAVLHVRDHCLCLHARRAARSLARRFDLAFQPLDLTNGQFSLMMTLNQPQPPRISRLAEFLAMDRTTLTATLKPLQRRGLVEVLPDPADRRGKVMRLTDDGRALLKEALPIWERTHAEVDEQLNAGDPNLLRRQLDTLAGVSYERGDASTD